MANNTENILAQGEHEQDDVQSAANTTTVDEQKNKFRKTLVKLSALAIFIGIVIVFAALGWFTMNKFTSGSGLGVNAGYNGFELKVTGNNIAYSDLYSYIDRTEGYRGFTGSQTDTAEGHDTIRWRISGTDDTIRPGSEGVLEFEVISTGADINNLRYSLDLSSFTADTSIASSQVNGETVTTEYVTDLHEISPTAGSADEKAGDAYLRSHIMFFTERTTVSTGVYRYHGFIDDVSSFTLTPDPTTHIARIYWIWPNTFGQIALDSSSSNDASYLGSGVVSVLDASGESGTDRTKIMNYLKNPNVFKDVSGSSDLIDALYSKRGSGASYLTEYNTLSGGYNAADQTIGNNIDYVMVTLNASVN